MQAVKDEQLMSWLQEGDRSCLGALFERHHTALYAFCVQLTGSRALAEDVVQEAFFRVLKKRHQYRGGQFKAWLFNIARNLAFDHLRKIGRQVNLDEAKQVGEADHRDPARTAEGSERQAIVERALARLPIKAREVILLGRFEFEGYDALAEALDCSPGAAKVRMHRAMKQLRELITEISREAAYG
ncbi:MAG: RNA polymerase sigma factor [Xanthomonadales bacterium]|nr:RNA polymerase sigma factor [Xanthomonadales bacterium]